jgi:hypothetical protein
MDEQGKLLKMFKDLKEIASKKPKLKKAPVI